MKFEVAENETIAECLERMKKEGFTPVRRMEKPIFHETETGIEVLRQQIIFVGRKIE
ncbi:NETI motif-containing protein [Macrococcus carouselicus]|uniref:NETI motif-containing protein n=1 Tax=Macrococcus carouselicus TaxID=69969 RepID=A0A9Q8FP17_9STAP|nr:NETI motif-containing protein [Macrococcus carouselicus]TDM00715.1 NETI motif-containing protein [Macrococcus carouselicus]